MRTFAASAFCIIWLAAAQARTTVIDDSGTLPYNETDVLEQGWVGYFPESVHYGPQERSEMRPRNLSLSS